MEDPKYLTTKSPTLIDDIKYSITRAVRIWNGKGRGLGPAGWVDPPPPSRRGWRGC